MHPLRPSFPFLVLLFAACGDSKLAPYAGTYTLDGAASVQATEQELASTTAGQDPAFAAKAKELIQPKLPQIAAGEFELKLKDDGTFTTHIEMLGTHEHPSGTWEIEGERVTLLYQDGRRLPGTLNGPTLRLTRADEGGQAIVFVLKR